jgi:hypothetical protein
MAKSVPLTDSTVQYSAERCSTVQYSTVQYSTVQYGTVKYSTWRSLLSPAVQPVFNQAAWCKLSVIHGVTFRSQRVLSVWHLHSVTCLSSAVYLSFICIDEPVCHLPNVTCLSPAQCTLTYLSPK